MPKFNPILVKPSKDIARLYSKKERKYFFLRALLKKNIILETSFQKSIDRMAKKEGIDTSNIEIRIIRFPQLCSDSIHFRSGFMEFLFGNKKRMSLYPSTRKEYNKFADVIIKNTKPKYLDEALISFEIEQVFSTFCEELLHIKYLNDHIKIRNLVEKYRKKEKLYRWANTLPLASANSPEIEI